MKHKLLNMVLLVLFTLCFVSAHSQDPNNPRWYQDPRTAVNLSSEYVPLPYTPTVIRQFTTEPRETITPNGILIAYPNVRVNPSNNFSQSETPIVSSPVNRNILFGSSNAYTFSTNQINSGVYVSTNGGVTWTGAENLGAGSINNQRGDPGPTISKFGTFLFTHLTSTTNFGGVTGMGANRSTNNGATWTNTFQVVNDANADKNLTATDDYPTSPYYGRSYFAWTSFGTNPANGRASRTVDDGVTWTTPIIINTTPAGHNAQGHDVATGPNGEVYVVWTAGISSSPFTEDFVGMAKSTNGGVSYVAAENIFDANGSRSFSFNGWGIRTNGFPRIAVDKTGGVRNGWIYVVVSQINLSPAGTDADIVLHRSSDGGATWSGGIRVNQDAVNNGKVQFFPAVCVDSDGGVNVVYYDNRLFPSVGDSCSVYISRSMDGGTTWTDVQIADHHFKPKQMSPFGGGYMGDYIGITQSIGKVVALWMDDKAATPGSNIPNAWAGALDISSSTICQDFSGVLFPPSDCLLEFTGTQYWTRQTPSAYGSGAGSADFDSWDAPAGTSQSIVTHKFLPVGANAYLTFDEAYAPWSGGNVDSLLIEISSDGGTTYSYLAKLWGGLGAQAGPLNTVFVGGTRFVPANNQWASKIYALPVGTNKIKFRARSGFGNDIWVDNICLKTLSAPVSSFGCAMSEGYYVPSPISVIPDTIRMYLHRVDYPNIIVDSAKSFSTNYGCFFPTFTNAESGSYYLVFKQRNSIEAWTNTGVINYTRGSGLSLDIINNNAAVYGNNQKLVDVGNSFWAMFSGEIEQDDVIDASDITLIYNDMVALTSGYVMTDVNGDSFVDVSDLVMTYNNALLVAQVIAPPGAEPAPSIENESIPEFKTDLGRQKYEMTKQQLSVKEVKLNSNQLIINSHKDQYEMMKKVIEENSKKVQRPDYNSINPGNGINPNSALGLPACK